MPARAARLQVDSTVCLRPTAGMLLCCTLDARRGTRAKEGRDSTRCMRFPVALLYGRAACRQSLQQSPALALARLIPRPRVCRALSWRGWQGGPSSRTQLPAQAFACRARNAANLQAPQAGRRRTVDLDANCSCVFFVSLPLSHIAYPRLCATIVDHRKYLARPAARRSNHEFRVKRPKHQLSK